MELKCLDDFNARSVLEIATISLLCTNAIAFAGDAPTAPNPPVRSLMELTLISTSGKVVLNPAASTRNHPANINVLPLDSAPINGFVPQVVFGLTDEQDKNGTLNFAAEASSHPASLINSLTLPVNQTPHYAVGIFDTGSQSHLITNDEFQKFNVEGAGRAGAYTQPITGVNGDEDTDISDALGFYATGFSNASVSAGGTIGVTSGSLRGQWNLPILSTEEGSQLPSLVGAPIAASYQTTIQNSHTKHLTINGTTYRTPDVNFGTLGASTPANYSKLTLGVQSANGVTPTPVYFPSIDNFNNFADDPSTPGFWASFTATATATHTAGTSGAQDFLFDTGAEVSVVSEDTAAQVGYFTGGENPSTPDFFVEVQGVGGTTDNVPGFYMQKLQVTTNGGPIIWTHVPVLVMNIPDPRDNVGFIPGILGMNLFTDRDLILNGGTTNPFLSISPAIAPQWLSTGGGSWSDDSTWSLGTPDGADLQANFLSTITSDATITVDSTGTVGFTVGSMKFDSPHRYTIAGPGTINFSAQSTGVAAINVVSGSHTISAPVVFESDTTINVASASSVLTMSGHTDGGSVSLSKTGAGKVIMNNVRAGALSIDSGTVAIATSGSPANVSKVKTLTIAGGATPTATLDLDDNDLIVTQGSYHDITAAIAYASDAHAWDRPGITSRAAKNSSPFIKTLGTLTGSQFKSTPGGGSTFDGLAISDDSIIVKLTYYGDADLNGQVDGGDYAHIDTGFNTGGSDWFHGDFDYNGHVDGADYVLIDTAFAAQNGLLRSAADFLNGGDPGAAAMNSGVMTLVRQHYAEFGEPYAAAFLIVLPEPAFLLFFAFATAYFAYRPRRTVWVSRVR